MTATDAIALRFDGPVAHLRIRRPDKRNALTEAMWGALERACAAIAASTAHAVVVEGEGGAFSAGADIDELREQLSDPARLGEATATVQRTQSSLQRLPQTTLAAIDGPCVGGGLGIALACDLRIATRRSRFALTPARLGLVYSPEDTRRLVQVVGLPTARRMLLCADLLDADEALRHGLVHECVEPELLGPTVERVLAALAATSPQARAAIKRVLAHVAGDPDVDATAARSAFADSFASADFAEGAAAFIAKRPPRFPSGSR
jgi:enoyl-CoA hydratase/carnithine racemase